MLGLCDITRGIAAGGEKLGFWTCKTKREPAAGGNFRILDLQNGLFARGICQKRIPFSPDFGLRGESWHEIPSLNVNLCKIIIVGFKTHLKDFTIAFSRPCFQKLKFTVCYLGKASQTRSTRAFGLVQLYLPRHSNPWFRFWISDHKMFWNFNLRCWKFDISRVLDDLFSWCWNPYSSNSCVAQHNTENIHAYFANLYFRRNFQNFRFFVQKNDRFRQLAISRFLRTWLVPEK